MPLAHSSKLFGVNDAAVYKLLTDPAGAPPTYAAKVDVVGVKALVSTLEMDLKELRGDNTLLAADAVFKHIKGKLTWAKFNFDVLAAATTVTTSDSGVTPNQKSAATMAQTDLPAYVKIEAQSKQVDYVGGDVHFVYFKCMPGSMDMLGFNEEDYNAQGLDFTAVPVIGTISGGPANAWAQAVANETAIAIA